MKSNREEKRKGYGEESVPQIEYGAYGKPTRTTLPPVCLIFGLVFVALRVRLVSRSGTCTPNKKKK